ncbi:response regulator [Agaribacterium haliotis]|uniref:response regulator n=1 Tax=Agaribacterium haliotis TaxID=2013869 RepID=UPI000BB535AF|nr:response regulator [Agaribacterium haliotis]
MAQFQFRDEAKPAKSTATEATPGHEPLKVLVVDDDDSVHAVTRLVLKRKTVHAHPIEIISCHSAAEARQLLTDTQPELVLGIIDVIMESDEAGIELIEWMRKQKKYQELPLAVRTGQPGIGAGAKDLALDHLKLLCYSYKTEVDANTLFSWVEQAANQKLSTH